MSEQQHYSPIEHLGRPLLWLASLVATSVLTLLIRDLWEAPRPRIELLSVELVTSGSDDHTLNIDPSLVSRIRYHPYIRDIESDSTIGEIQQALESSRRSQEVWARLSAHINELIRLVRTQSAAIDRAERRREFLATLTERGPEWGVLERIMKNVTDDLSLPDRYGSHPESDRTLRVNLRRSTFVLSEVNPHTEAARAASASDDVNTYDKVLGDAMRTNVLRRLFVYYEPEILLPFLETCDSQIKDAIRSGKDINKEIEVAIAQSGTERVAVQVLVSNSGSRPLAIRREGLLKLRVPQVEGPAATTTDVPLLGDEEGAPVTIVDGGEAVVVSLRSRRSLREIIDQQRTELGGSEWKGDTELDQSRLVMLWRAKTPELKASVILAHAGADPVDIRAGESSATVVGASSVNELYKALAGEQE